MEPNMTAKMDVTRDQPEVSSSSAGNLLGNTESVHADVASDESQDLISQRQKIQQQILALERYFDAEGHSGLTACSSSDGDSEDEDRLLDDEKNLDAQHLKIQREIKELEKALGLGTEEHRGDNVDSSDIPMSDEDSDDDNFELPMNTETCLEMNLVYQEVLKEKLAELEQLLQENIKEQKELENQMHGPTSSRVPSAKVLFIGNFMKPFFKDKVTGLGPPANPETKEKMLSGKQPCDEKDIKRWEGWQKSLLINAIVQDTLKRLLQPKLSKMEYLRDKAARATGEDKETLQKQIEELDEEMANIRALNDDDLMGARNDDHDWEKIANVDFEGMRQAEDVMLFWKNYLHPSINKSTWKLAEIEKLKAIVQEHQGQDWESIAEKLGTNRTAFMCFQSHQRYILMDFKKRAWSKEEDDRLRDLVHRKRIGNFIPYTQMTYFMDGRDSSQLIYRWTQVLDPSLKKGPWSKDEDELLLKAVEKHGVPNWWRIKFEVPGRTDGQCRDRYVDCLNDEVKKGHWTEEEENLLKLAVQKYGVGKWARIASEVPHRIDSQCLQKWKTLCKNTIPRRSSSNSIIPQVVEESIGKSIEKKEEKKKKKKEKGRRRRVKVEDEEIEYMETDEEENGSESTNSEKEAELMMVKYVQPPLQNWIPRQTDKTTEERERLRCFFVKAPEDAEETNTERPQGGPRCSDYYTILNNSGCPMKSIKKSQAVAQHLQIPKKRTFNEDMILVPRDDVRKLHEFMVTRTSKSRQKGQESTADQNSLESEQGQISADPGPGEGPSVDPTEGTDKAASEQAVEGARKHSSVSAAPGRVGVRPTPSCQQLLKAAICPWMGHILIPFTRLERQKVEADVVRERAAEVDLSGTKVFILYLKLLSIDTEGCKRVISMRKNTVSNKGLTRISHKQGVGLSQNTRQTKLTAFQAKPVRQTLQQVLIPVLQPQQAQQLQTSQPFEASKGSPQLAPQAHPGGTKQAKPQLQIPTMPKLLIPHGVQLAQPVLIGLTPGGNAVASPTSANPLSSGPVVSTSACSEPVSMQSTCEEPGSSQSTCSKPGSSQATCSKSSKAETRPSRPSKRARKPTEKAKQLMEEVAAKAKSPKRHKRPRLEGPPSAPQPVAPVAWIITPPANMPINSLNSSALVGRNVLPCPLATGTTSSSPSPAQANSPMNISGVFPGAFVFTVPNVPVSSPPTGSAITTVSGSTFSSTVTSCSPSEQGMCSAASPAVSCIPAPSSPVLSLTTVRAQGPQLLQGSPRPLLSPLPGPFQRAPGPSHPVAGVFQTLPPVVAFPQPVVQLLPPGAKQPPVIPDCTAGFDTSLVFMEDRTSVQVWMSRRKGTFVSPSGRCHSYLPPFVSTVNTLQSLLRAKTSLAEHSLSLLPNSSSEATSNEKRDEQLDAVRSLVKERFGSNPAYQILKARFLACFAVPALLATIDPVRKVHRRNNEDNSGDDHSVDPKEG